MPFHGARGVRGLPHRREDEMQGARNMAELWQVSDLTQLLQGFVERFVRRQRRVPRLEPRSSSEAAVHPKRLQGRHHGSRCLHARTLLEDQTP